MQRMKLIKVFSPTAIYDYDKALAFIKYAKEIHEVWGKKVSITRFSTSRTSPAHVYTATLLPTVVARTPSHNSFYKAYRAFAVVNVAIAARVLP